MWLPRNYRRRYSELRFWREEERGARRHALHFDPAAGEGDASLTEPAHHQGIEAMFLAQDARREPVGTVAGQHRHGGLGDDRPAIDVGLDEMHGAAAHPDTGVERLLLGLQALEQRQQRGMAVDDPAPPALWKPRAHDPHEAGQRHQPDAMLL